MRSTSIEILGFVFDIDRDFWPQLTFFEGFLVRQHIPMRHIPKATFTHATFTHRRHLPIASIRHDAWSIRYLIVVAYGYLSRENWDLIEAMGKCRLWVNVAWVNVTMGICRMGICRLAGISFKAELLRRRGKAISYLETTLPLSCDSLLFPSYPFPLFVLNT